MRGSFASSDIFAVQSKLEEFSDACSSTVFSARRLSTNDSRDIVALQIFDPENENFDYDIIKAEINMLKQCKHKNIIGIMEVRLISQKILYILPYFEFGSLKNLLITKYTYGLLEAQISFICRQILQALEYLHKKFIVHRGIKASHILIGSNNRVCLSGFDNAAIMLKDGVLQKSLHDFNPNMQYNLSWLAPEVLEQLPEGYTFKADIYMLGVTAVELANGREPYRFPPIRILYEKHNNNRPVLIDSSTIKQVSDVTWRLEQGENLHFMHYERTFKQKFHKFVDLCLRKNPLERPEASVLLKKRRSFCSDVKKVEKRGLNLMRDNSSGSMISPSDSQELKVTLSELVNLNIGGGMSPAKDQGSLLDDFDWLD